MCDLNKNPNLNKINHKNKSFNSFITNIFVLSFVKATLKFYLLFLLLKMFHLEPTPNSLKMIDY